MGDSITFAEAVRLILAGRSTTHFILRIAWGRDEFWRTIRYEPYAKELALLTGLPGLLAVALWDYVLFPTETRAFTRSWIESLTRAIYRFRRQKAAWLYIRQITTLEQEIVQEIASLAERLERLDYFIALFSHPTLMPISSRKIDRLRQQREAVNHLHQGFCTLHEEVIQLRTIQNYEARESSES